MKQVAFKRYLQQNVRLKKKTDRQRVRWYSLMQWMRKWANEKLKVLSFFEMKNGKMRTHKLTLSHTQTYPLLVRTRKSVSFTYAYTFVCFFFLTLWKGKYRQFTRSTCITIIMLIVWWIDDITSWYYCCVYLLMLISLVKSAAKLYSISMWMPNRFVCLFGSFAKIYKRNVAMDFTSGRVKMWWFSISSAFEYHFGKTYIPQEWNGNLGVFFYQIEKNKFKCNWQSHAMHRKYADCTCSNENW